MKINKKSVLVHYTVVIMLFLVEFKKKKNVTRRHRITQHNCERGVSAEIP